MAQTNSLRMTHWRSSAIRCAKLAARVTIAVCALALVWWSVNGIRFLASPSSSSAARVEGSGDPMTDPLMALVNEGGWSLHVESTTLKPSSDLAPKLTDMLFGAGASNGEAHRAKTELFPLVPGAKVLCEKRDLDNQRSAQLIRLPEDLVEVRAALLQRGWRWEELLDDFQSTSRLSRQDQSMKLVDLGCKDSYRVFLVVPEIDRLVAFPQH